jgi:hypothetical protein
MAKKKKSTTKPLTQKQLKEMLASAESNLAATKERLTQAEETYTSLTTPSPAATIDSDLIRSRVTGLSETQQQAKDTLLDIAEEQGGGYLRTLKSAGQVVPKPTEVLPEGVEWKWSPKTGGSGEWIKVRTSEPFTGGNGGNGGNGGSGGGDGNGSQGSDLAALLASQAARDKLAADQAAAAALEEKRRAGQSAFDLLKVQFDEFGLGGLVADVEKYIKDGLSQAEFTLRLRTESDAYKKRFAANAQRIKAGLRALSEAEYITLEDQYQNVMRNYGLPASYYARGEMGRQEGFEKFIAGDVSATELEDRIQTAQNRVINAAPEVSRALREFYPDITGGDILAYALDPQQALNNIKRKVGAAEIGAGAMQAGLATGLARAEELQRFGVTGEQARQGFQTIGGFLPRAEQLGSIYGKQGLGPYTQATAEAEVFGTTGAVDAERKRKQLAQLESAQFSGQVGAAGGALGRERAGQF